MSYDLYQGEMSKIFDLMYQKFIDYDEEYNFYAVPLNKYFCKRVVEMGCGTGNLALRFAKDSFSYLGLDYSADMLAIAKARNPELDFNEADMRDFTLQNKADAILLTGRTSSYIISNADVHHTFDAVRNNLTEEGIFVFDFIDANRYIPYILSHKNIRHSAEVDGVSYFRIGNWTPLKKDNFLVQWDAEYYKKSALGEELLKKDSSEVRVFTLNEMELFLAMNGFEILEVIDRTTYAYDTYVIVARKK